MDEVKRVDTIYAYICIDDDGNETLPAVYMDGVLSPIVGTVSTLASMHDVAQVVANKTRKTLRLYHFQNREMVATVTPEKRAAQ
jgi:hypothetical protein